MSEHRIQRESPDRFPLSNKSSSSPLSRLTIAEEKTHFISFLAKINMLIEKVIDFYAILGKRQPGNPFRLSNSGRCARALAYQRFPTTFKAEPIPARALMV